MNLELFANIIESYTPDDWEFWAAHKREEYNLDKSINDTMLMIYPNPFPVNWRDKCWYNLEMALWFGKLVDIKRDTTGQQQHNPYSPLELRSGMYDIAKDVIQNMNNSDYIQVLPDVSGTFYDSPDGKSVNRQVWLEVPITVKFYNIGDSFDYYLDQTITS